MARKPSKSDAPKARPKAPVPAGADQEKPARPAAASEAKEPMDSKKAERKEQDAQVDKALAAAKKGEKGSEDKKGGGAINGALAFLLFLLAVGPASAAWRGCAGRASASRTRRCRCRSRRPAGPARRAQGRQQGQAAVGEGPGGKPGKRWWSRADGSPGATGGRGRPPCPPGRCRRAPSTSMHPRRGLRGGARRQQGGPRAPDREGRGRRAQGAARQTG
jgi:hypothetical protein